MGLFETVMVIDDSKTVLKVVGDMLIEGGNQPVLTTSFEEAMSFNEMTHADLALVDLVMPGMDGFEGIKRLRGIDPDLKIIAMSAGDASMDPYHLLRLARRIGADAVIKKPFQAAGLISLIKQIDEVSGRNCIRVLVIDDSRTVCMAVADMLDDARFKVATANSGKEALERSDIIGIDVVLTDIFMPGESGIEVIQHVREHWPEVRLIAMSAGYGDEMDGGKALAAARKVGAIASIQKPFKADDLTTIINRVTIDL